MKRKSQLWYLDFIIGLSIFTLMIIMAFRYTSLRFSDNEAEQGRVWNDAQRLTESLLSEGIPKNWTEGNVISIGVLSEDNAIDLNKIETLKNLTIVDYDKTKFIIGLKSDYIIHFEGATGSIINLTNQSYIGKPGITEQDVLDSNPKDELFYTRYVVFRHDSVAEIIAMKVLVWQK
jgi:hypothetical protein